jgi:DNA-binding LacI/PurR family transcriptional regulator
MRHRCIPEAPELICVTGPWGREAGAAAVRRLLADGVPFDAVFALNDTLGLGVLRALGEAGVRVPDEVAVIGFDNIDESQFSVPSLSSVELTQPRRPVGLPRYNVGSFS